VTWVARRRYRCRGEAAWGNQRTGERGTARHTYLLGVPRCTLCLGGSPVTSSTLVPPPFVKLVKQTAMTGISMPTRHHRDCRDAGAAGGEVGVLQEPRPPAPGDDAGVGTASPPHERRAAGACGPRGEVRDHAAPLRGVDAIEEPPPQPSPMTSVVKWHHTLTRCSLPNSGTTSDSPIRARPHRDGHQIIVRCPYGCSGAAKLP